MQVDKLGIFSATLRVYKNISILHMIYNKGH